MHQVLHKFLLNKSMHTLQMLKVQVGNSAQCCVAAWIGGEFGAEWIHVYVWLSPFVIISPEIITLLIG